MSWDKWECVTGVELSNNVVMSNSNNKSITADKDVDLTTQIPCWSNLADDVALQQELRPTFIVCLAVARCEIQRTLQTMHYKWSNFSQGEFFWQDDDRQTSYILYFKVGKSSLWLPLKLWSK